MTYQTKYRIATGLTGVLVVGAIQGLSILRRDVLAGQSAVFANILLFGSVIFGIGAALSSYYYKARKDDVKTQQQIAVETLAALAKQRKKERNRSK